MTSPANMKGILTWIKRWPFTSAPRTSYDRPPTAPHGFHIAKIVNESDTDGRLSKFVEPVSSLITRIAFKFFSFVCRKRLTEHPDASGSRKKLFVKLDAPTVNSVEQRLVEANTLSTSSDIGLSDIEKQIIQRRNERAKVIHLLKMIKSQSSKIHNSGVPKKVLKRDHTFLDDDESLLCRPHKIQKKLGEEGKQFVDNIPFTTTDMEGAFTSNDKNDAFTSSRSSSPIIKSTNTTTSCHATLPLQRNSGVEFIEQGEEIDQDEMIVKNVPFTTTISENVITTNDMNDASSLSSTNTSISSHVALPSQRKSSFLMSVPEFLDLDEENDETNIYAQSSLDLDQPKLNLLEQKSSNIYKYEVENKPNKVLKRDHTFLDDDESLSCHRPHKIHKNLGEKKKQVVDNISFTTNLMESAITTNDMDNAFTASRNISPIIKSTNTTASCHATLPLQKSSGVEFIGEDEEIDQDEMIVENAQFTTAISEDVIATNDLNDASSLSRSRGSIISSTNAIISSHVAPPSAPTFFELDEENDENIIYVQSSMDLDQPKPNLLEQKSLNMHEPEEGNKPKFIDKDEEIDQDEMIVENTPFTTAISEDVIAANDMNDASSLSISRRFIISSTNATISSFVTLPLTPEFHDLDEENDETNTSVHSFMDLDQPKTNLLEQKFSEVENKQKKVLKRDRSFLNDEESLLCPPRKIHKKLGEEKKQVVDNISFTTTAMEGAISTNDIIDAFTYSRSSLLIIESTNATASCHATLPSQRKPSFYMSAPEFLDIDEENDETNIYVQSSMGLDQPK